MGAGKYNHGTLHPGGCHTGHVSTQHLKIGKRLVSFEALSFARRCRKCQLLEGVEYLLMMLSKNLRSILYYIIGVSGVCLVIEVSKRTPGHMYGNEDLYEVQTAKPGSLRTTPEYRPDEGKSDASEEEGERNEEDYDELIPKRNRGRGAGEKDGGSGRVKGRGRGINGKGREKWQMGRGNGEENDLAKVGRKRPGKWKQSEYYKDERGGKRVR